MAGFLGQCKIRILFIMIVMSLTPLTTLYAPTFYIPIWTRIHQAETSPSSICDAFFQTSTHLIFGICYDLTVFIGFCWFLLVSVRFMVWHLLMCGNDKATLCAKCCHSWWVVQLEHGTNKNPGLEEDYFPFQRGDFWGSMLGFRGVLQM